MLSGDRLTGVSAVQLSLRKFDAGSVFHQKTIDVGRADTYESMVPKLCKLCSDVANQLIDEEAEGKERQSIPQDESLLTKAPKFKVGENLFKLSSTPQNSFGLEGSTPSASKIYNMYRGFKGSSFKTLKLSFKGKELFIDNCYYLGMFPSNQDQSTGPSLSPKDLESIQLAHKHLPTGSLIYFNNIKPLRNNLLVRFPDGYIGITRMHYDKSKEESSAEFIKREINSEEYREIIGVLLDGDRAREEDKKRVISRIARID